jgi:hypothetical protein
MFCLKIPKNLRRVITCALTLHLLKVSTLKPRSGKTKVILDFLESGAVLLTQDKIKLSVVKGRHQHVLPFLAYYAVSPELWGPQGKWVRFHERLQQLFVKFDLLKDSPQMGLYHLRPEAQKLALSGFQGTLEKDYYSLTLPWTFSLSGLEKLEKTIRQEF